MNNYCTNCGKSLDKEELICKNCNTPIVDLPYNYVYVSPEKKKFRENVLITILICLLCFLGFYFAKVIINNIKIYSLQKKYVEPYLERKFGDKDFVIEYDSSGDCIISGDCYFDPVMGCDGGACEEYEYLEGCKSYYYSVKIADEEYIITVFYKDNVYSVVEGKNITVNEDEKINSLQKEYVEPYLERKFGDKDFVIKYDSSGDCIISGDCYFDPVMGCDGGSCQEYEYLEGCMSYYYSVKIADEEYFITVFYKDNVYSVVEGKNITVNNIKNNDEKEDDKINSNLNEPTVIIEKYPYESRYYMFNSYYKKNEIYLDIDGTIMEFFVGILNDNSSLYISGNVSNPKGVVGNVDVNTKYYDSKYNEIGNCSDTINFLGKGYSNISFSCHISQSEMLTGKSFDDISYYKVYISSAEFND